MRIEDKMDFAINTPTLLEQNFNSYLLEAQNMPRGSRRNPPQQPQSQRAMPSSSTNSHQPQAATLHAWQTYTQQQNSERLADDGAALASTFISNLDNDDHVLDLGTGTGHFPLELAKAARQDRIRINITAVDFMPNIFFNATGRGYGSNIRQMVSYKQSSIENFEFNRQYNAINADAVLPYASTEQQLRIINRIGDALAPQGNAVVQVTRDPNATSSTGEPLHALSDHAFNTMIENLKMRGLLPEDPSSAIDQNGHFTTIYLYNPQES